MKTFFLWIPFFLVSIFNVDSSLKTPAPQKTGTVKITFVNTVKGKPLELNTGKYSNPFAEEYSISKFKYYIGNVLLQKDTAFWTCADCLGKPENFHLIDESDTAALHFTLDVNAGNYTVLNFMIGVDSLNNVSGAQTGALDPLNDMFWTWNSGYVMAKLEGNSPQSKVVNNKLEFHIGGFAGENKVLKNIKLGLPFGKILNVQPGKTSEIIIEADIDKWWQQPNDIKIAEHPVCTTPGLLAKKIADNYSKMFTVKDVVNN